MAATPTDRIELYSQAAGTFPVMLTGGYYAVSFGNLASSPTLNIQKLLSDGSTINLVASPLAAAGVTFYQWPPGLIQLVVAVGTADVALAKTSPK